MSINEDSDISLVHAVSVYRKNHKVCMRDTQAGETLDPLEWHRDTGRPIPNLYSRAARPPETIADELRTRRSPAASPGPGD